MAVVTACAYGHGGGSPGPFDGDDDDGRGRHRPVFHDRCCIVHGVVMPPPPPPPLYGLHSCSKAAASRRSRHPGLCTEGLGSESSESSGDLDLGGTVADDEDDIQGRKSPRQQDYDDQGEEALTPARKRAFPPPISVIGAAGKPWQYLRAQRGGGRLVLREVRIPSRELLRACREDGRLKLHFAHPNPEEENNVI